MFLVDKRMFSSFKSLWTMSEIIDWKKKLQQDKTFFVISFTVFSQIQSISYIMFGRI